MNLHDFVKTYVCPNSLIRLWFPLPKEDGHGHVMIVNGDGRKVGMNHEILRSNGWQATYSNHEVIGVTDICVDDFYREAINIVIIEQ